MKRWPRTIWLALAGLALAASGWTGPPGWITYQGYLADSSGQPIDGKMYVTFLMYAKATGGSPVWQQTTPVRVADGVYTVALGGSTAPLPKGLQDCNFLEVVVMGAPVASRQRLTSVLYALEATNSQLLGRKEAAYFLNASNLSSGTIREARLPQNAIDSSEVQDEGVRTGDLAPGCVTSQRLAPGAVTTEKIADGAVSPEDIALGTISEDHIPFGASLSGYGAYGMRVHNRASSELGVGVFGANYSNSPNSAAVVGWTDSAAGAKSKGVYARAVGPPPAVALEARHLQPDGTALYVSNGQSLFSGPVEASDRVRVAAASNTAVMSVSNQGSATRGLGVEVYNDALDGDAVYVAATNTAVGGTTTGLSAICGTSNGAAIVARHHWQVGKAIWVTRGMMRLEDGDLVVDDGRAYCDTFEARQDVFIGGDLWVSGDIINARSPGDLAENYRTGDVSPADVVVIAPSGDLVRCARECDTAVAGIVSAHPRVRLKGGIEDGEGVAPLALTGRVLCKVDARKHPVKAGDLLTTSATPGHAMKAVKVGDAVGAIIGTALEDLKSGTGRILVLVAPR